MNRCFFAFVCVLTSLIIAPLYARDLITKVTIEHNKVTYSINKAFKKQYLKEKLFIEYDNDIDLSTLDYSLITLPCITLLLSLVWISGKKYYIESMDQDFFYSMKRLKKVFKILYPQTAWKGELIPRKLTINTLPLNDSKDQPALLFSGGLDSTAASLLMKDKKQLLITAWGHWDLPLKNEKIWNLTKDRITNFAQTYGHNCSFIRSNYFDFISRNKNPQESLSPEITHWRMNTIENIGWAGITAPLLYLKGHSTLHIASGSTWDTLYPTASFPFIDGNIVCAGIHYNNEQFDMKRIDKVECITTMCKHNEIERPFLTVCAKRTGSNCTTCRKCLTTTLALFMFKENPQDYGFLASIDVAFENTQKLIACLLKRPFSVADIEFLYELKKKAQELKEKDIPVDPRFFSIIDFEFEEKLPQTIEYAVQKRINWPALHKQFPAIAMPSSLKGCLK